MAPPNSHSVLQVAAPSAAGGLESVTVALAGGLAGRGHRVGLAAVIAPGDEGNPVIGRARALGVEVFPLALPARSYLREVAELRRCARAWQADILHTHGYRADVLGGIAGRLEGIPQVTTAHGFTGGGLKNRLFEWLQRAASRRAEAVVAVSRSVEERLLHSGVHRSRIHLLQNAPMIADPLPREEARARLGISAGAPAIGWVGRVSPEKGVDIFLRALSAIRGEAWTAHVIGDGPARLEGTRLAGALGLSDRVRWHGTVQEAGRLLPAFDVLMLTSRTEGTPVILLEAARAAVPVVASAVGGVPDMYEPGEVDLIRPDRPEGMSEAVRAILADLPAAKGRATRASASVRSRFDPERWLDAHERLYGELRLPRRATSA